MEPKQIIDISEKDGILLCRIQVPPRNYAFSKTLVYRTTNVIEMLVRKGYNIDQILEESFVHNKSDKSDNYDGTWKFKLAPKPSTLKKSATKARSSKTTKTKE